MEELREAQTALRRNLSRVEDELDEVKRKKASREDLAAVADKYSAMETDTRNAIGSIKSDIHDIRDFMRRISDRLDETETTVISQKKQVNEIRGSAGERASSAQATPWRFQLALYGLAGVGVLALLWAAPQVVTNMGGIRLPVTQGAH